MAERDQATTAPDARLTFAKVHPVGEESAPLTRRVFAWLRWPLALGLLSWLLYSNWDTLRDLSTREIRWQFLLIAFVTCSSSIILTFYRWQLLVRALDFPFRFIDAMRLGFLGYLWNYAGPGVVGGDIAKAFVLAREQKSRRAAAVATVLLDRVLGLIALLIVGAGAVFFVSQEIDHREKAVATLVGGAVSGVIGLVVVMNPALSRAGWVERLTAIPKIGGMLGDLRAAASMYQSKPRVIIATVLMSVVGHFGIISSFYFCARAVGDVQDVPDYATHLLLIPLAEIVGVIVPTPAGIGALEGAVQTAYQLAAFNPGLGLLAAGAYRATTVVIASIGALVYLSARSRIQSILAESKPGEASPEETAQPESAS